MAVLIPGMPAASQEKPVTESDIRLIEEARRLFDGGDYAAASNFLDRWGATAASRKQGYLDNEEIEYMQAVINAERNPMEGKEMLQAFLEHYPSSIWANRVKALTGISCAARGEYSEALVWFDDCDPRQLGIDDVRELTLYHAISLMRTGSMDDGCVLLTVLENLGGYEDEVLFYKSCADYSKGNFAEAKEGFNKSLRQSQFTAWSQLFLAEIALRENDAANAETIALSLSEYSDATVAAEASRVLGEAYYTQGKWKDADRILSKYVDGNDNADRLDVYRLGMSNWQMGNFERAIGYLGQVSVRDDALEQNAWYHMGLSSLELGKTNDAMLAFEQVASMTADKSLSEAGLFNYAMCVRNSGYSPFAEPVDAFERFLNEYPESKYTDKVNEQLVEVFMQSPGSDAALEAIARIKNPGRRILEAKQQLLYRRGVELYAGSQYDKVADYLTKAVEMSEYGRQTAADASFWLAETDFRQGRYSQAAFDYRTYMNMTADKGTELYGLALYGAGYAAFKSGRWDDALTQWNKLTGMRRSLVSEEIIGDAYARMGDSHFYKRDYAKAETCYENSLKSYPETGDYALYQMALTKGLRKDYAAKSKLLERISEEYPESPYCAQALFEEGRSYQQMDKTASAINAFERVVSRFPKSELARKSQAEIALMYYQDDKFEKAIDAYKKVIESYPGSDEAATAMRDLKSIYVETGHVDQFLAYSEGVAGAAPIAVDERDSLVYTSAEILYTKGDMANAETALLNYLQQYPEGAYKVNASYYLGNIFNGKKDYANALEYWLNAAENDNSRFCVEALERAAGVAYDTGDFSLALASYGRLLNHGGSAELIRSASLGAVRSAFRVENYGSVLDYAEKALAARLDSDVETEVRYYRAKALYSLDRTAEAREAFNGISEDTRSSYGAESDYMLSQILFDSGDVSGAEKNVMDLISGGTPHAYWLARSFILLSDIYASQDKTLEARQYLLSLKQNYRESDDIATMIGERLKKLE